MRSPTTTADSDRAGHASDADLIRHLDGEAPLSVRGGVSDHLRACALCAARDDLLRARRRRLEILLVGTDVAAPPLPNAATVLAEARQPRWPRMSVVRWAAAIFLIAGGLAAQPAVRRWIGSGWHLAIGRTSPAQDVAPPQVPVPPAPARSIAFEPEPGPFTIRFDVLPTDGSLVIIADQGTRASAEVVARDTPELLVTPRGIYVRNGHAATAGYQVTVPQAARRVYVRFGAAPTAADLVVELGHETRRVIRFGVGRER